MVSHLGGQQVFSSGAIPSSALPHLPTLVVSAMGATASQRGTLGTHLLLQLHTDGIGFLEKDGIAPEQVTEGSELVPFPLPKGPESQLELPLCPLHCGDRGAITPLLGGRTLVQRCSEDPRSTLLTPTECIKTLWWHPALTFILRFFLFLICLRVISRVHLLLQSLQFAFVVLGEAGRGMIQATRCDLAPCCHIVFLPPPPPPARTCPPPSSGSVFPGTRHLSLVSGHT